jgi:hypothetical protein
MAEFDHGVKEIADQAGRLLARLAGVDCRRWRPLESTLPATTELLADRAFQALLGQERVVVYFEFYTRWTLSAPWDMLAKSGLLSKRVRLPTVCIAIVLRSRGFRSLGGTFRLAAAGETTQQLRLRQVGLWQLTPEPWWEKQPGLMALYPLCHHGQQPREAIQHAAAAIERQLPDEVEQANGLYLLDLFGGLAYSRLDVGGIIGREKMKLSRFGKEMKEEGRQEARRLDILDILEDRFGAGVRGEFETAVNAIADFDELGRLVLLAGKVADVDSFRRALAQAGIPS